MNVALSSSPTTLKKRALLEARLRQIASQDEPRPLSFPQQRLWFLDQLQPNSPLYNVASVARVKGPLHFDLLEQAINGIVRRHESLRTRFVRQDETPVQVIDEDANLKLQVHDLSRLTNSEQEHQTSAFIKAEILKPFDLASDRLIRVAVVSHSPNTHVLVVVMHHIISDEWSLKVFFNELSTSYSALVRGQPAELCVLPIQYSDFAAWQRKWMRGEIIEKQLSFWKNLLQGELPMTELPLDRPRKPVPEFNGNSISRLLSQEVSDRIRKLAEAENATLFMVMLAAFKALVLRYTGKSDIIIGSPIAGRNRLETEGLIGFFVNTLPLRTDLSGNPPFRELVQRVRSMTLDAYAHQDLPLDRLVEEIRPERSLTHMPFTRLMFTLQTNLLEELQLDGATLVFEDIESQTAKFDLTLVAQETKRGLVLKAEYDTDLFEEGTISRLLEHFEILLAHAASKPETPVSSLELMSAEERSLLLTSWSGVGSQAPALCIHQVFEAQAERFPKSIAVQFGDKELTYEELNSRANQVAFYLRELGVGPDSPVAICASRSVELIVGILGILKAGGAYVPLDPSYPRERLQFMLDDTRATVLLSEQSVLSDLPQFSSKCVCLDADWELLARQPRQNPVNRCSPESLAYIMYTSGSTGSPKGVCIPHAAVCRLVLETNYIKIDPADSVAQVSNVSFDAATFEIWGALLNGARLVKICKDLALSPPEFALELRRQKISALFLTTALFNQLAHDVPDAFATVRTVMFGGEAADPKFVRAVLRKGKPQRLLNVYGPTENTTFSTWHLIPELKADASGIPIGIPISNTEAYILDSEHNPVPIGVPGELHLGGSGLARGYWQQKELTDRCFISVALGDGSKKRLYKTGDLARWLPCGAIEFAGRVDNQVKIRGFRVELGEVESILAQHPAVNECAVTLLGTNSGNKRLAAYVVPNGELQFNASEIRAFLKGKLPDYMVPSVFVSLERLPWTPNGKVDRKALPQPDQARPELEGGYAPPRDEVEARLATIWESVLNVRPVGIEDKFFDLGGHSLLAVRLISQIEKAFGRKLKLATIFQAQTISQLAAVLREDVGESSLNSRTSLVEIQAHGDRLPLFLVHGAGGGMFWGYVNLSRHLGKEQPVYGFRSQGLDGKSEFETVEELAAHYVHDLRKFQPVGPYHLGGYCFGGNVAFEMARQLHESGEEVALLALINAAPANSRYLKIPWTPKWFARFAKNLVYWTRYFLSWTAPQRREFFIWKWASLKRRLQRVSSSKNPGINGHTAPQRVDPGDLVDLSSYSPDQRKVWEAHIRALLKFRPKHYSGSIHLFRSAGHPLLCSFEPDYGWGEFVGGKINIAIVPGAHEKVLEEPCVSELATRLNDVIAQRMDLPAKLINAPATAAIGTLALAGVGYLGTELIENLTNGIAVLTSTITTFAQSGKRSRDEEQFRRWNNNKKPFDLSGNYIRHFEKQVLRTPENPAVRDQSQTVTYQELNARANRLAHRLKEAGVQPGELVGICLGRSVDLIVSLLAVWKCRAAYLPLDPQYPKERLSYMLEDSKAKVLLLHNQFTSTFEKENLLPLVVDSPEEITRIAGYPATFESGDGREDDLAYVIYTSGSTGKPKGVEILHRSLLNHNFSIMEVYKLNSSDCAVQFSPISFDISVEEIFPTLLSGALLVLRTEEAIASVAKFLQFVSQKRITVLNLPTAYWHEIVEHLRETKLPDCVRLVAIGGEKASDEAFRQWKHHLVGRQVTLVNTYGPTESTVTTTFYVARSQDDALPIGLPLPNIQLAVLDPEMQRVPIGQTGELYIGGDGLARGYLNRPELTAERFVSNPFEDISSERLYKTGDLVRFRPNGDLEFVGRVDQQVKIRGFRIELGEIESTLLTNPAIKDAAVLAREDKPGHKKLVAYVVPRNGALPHLSEMLSFLRERLPVYMIPANFVSMPSFPLTPAGKIDRLSLPPPGAKRPDLDQEYIEPRTPVEISLATIYAEVLEIERVGIFDNFFDLGGHSLVATQLLTRLQDTLQVDITLGTVFSFPCIAALAEEIERQFGHAVKVPLSALPGAKRVELTDAQIRTWFLDQFDPHSSPYNIPVGVRLTGPLDVAALEKSLAVLAGRHEALRSVFPDDNGRPVQVVLPNSNIPLRTIDLGYLEEGKREAEAAATCANAGSKSYITYRPLLNPLLLRLGTADHILLLTFHEIAVDRDSTRLLLRELAEGYEEAVTGLPLEPRAAVEAPASEQEVGSEPCIEDLESYWKQKLQDAPELLQLPADHPRPPHQSDSGRRISMSLPRDLSQNLARRESQNPGSAERVLLTAFQVLLSRYTNRTDIVLGIPTRARRAPRETIGPFEDCLVLRHEVPGHITFNEAVERSSNALEETRAHDGLPFSRVVQLVRPVRNSSHTPIFQVVFCYEAESPFRACPAGLAFMPFEVDCLTSKYDLTLRAHQNGTYFGLSFTFSTDLFTSERIERLARHLKALLRAALQTPDQPISRLPIMDEEEQEQVLGTWNKTERPFADQKTLVQLFDEQVRRSPGKEALLSGDQRLTYRDLADHSARVAAKLRALGVGTGGKVALCMERSWELVAAILGTLRTGAAYLPIDPAYPKDRIAFMLQDASAAVLIAENWPTQCVESVKLLRPGEIDWSGPVPELPPARTSADDLAYIIYTSGSTGKPKGVLIEHRNAVSFLHWAKDAFDPEELSGVLASTSICFDLSVFELFAPLCWGGRIILAPNALTLPSLSAAQEVRLVNTVPSAARELVRIKGIPDSVRTINLAGEPLSTTLVDQIYVNTRVKRVMDLYGPSETTTYSTGGPRLKGENRASIGKPLPNQQVYLLDSNCQPVPIGVPGELCIGGAGVARGYLNRPEITAERFIENPFRQGDRLYRTGDLARWRSDGNLEYIGRLDDQVKIRGFRIELGEIESALRAIPGVINAVVMAKEDKVREKTLAAYVAAKGSELTGSALQNHLAKCLPSHMVPSTVFILEELPLTPNGKVDRKALLALEAKREPKSEFVAPRNDLEARLLAIWKSCLSLDNISVQDSFFDLGGHSLLAIRIVAEVRETLKTDLPLFSLFETPTIESLAKEIQEGRYATKETSGPQLTPASRTSPIPAAFVQERLWFLDQLDPGSDAYNIPAALRLKGPLDVQHLERALNQIVQRHEALRTTFELSESGLVQKIVPELKLALPVTELADDDRTTERLDQLLADSARKPFDLATGPLIRAELFRFTREDHVFLVTMHHTISDGWSLAILFRELDSFYSGAGLELPKLDIQYADYAVWQRTVMSDAALEKELSYWKKSLRGAPTAVKFPKASEAQPSPRAAERLRVEYPEEFLSSMARRAQEYSTTPFALLMAALTITLSKWTGQQELVVGTVVAGRAKRELENLIGCFMNFLPVRLKVSPDVTGEEFLKSTRDVLLKAQSHQDCPFEKIVGAINPARKGDSNPLYNVALLWQNFPHQLFEGPGLEAENIPVSMSSALLDLRFEAEQEGSSLSLLCEYRSGQFEQATIASLMEALRRMLETLIATPAKPVREMQVQVLHNGSEPKQPEKPSRKLAISGTFTTEPLQEALGYWIRELQLDLEPVFAPYNQVFQELLNPESMIGSNKDGLNVILVRLEDWLQKGDSSTAPGQQLESLSKTVTEFTAAIQALSRFNSSTHLVCFCPPSRKASQIPGWEQFTTHQEQLLRNSIAALPNVHLLTSEEIAHWYEVTDYQDETSDELGHVPYTPLFFTALGTSIIRKFHGLNRAPTKVIVLDCDNTLWSGVCGEDGAAGIKLDKPWKALQEFMRKQRDAGVLLAISSKNNPEDVEEVFSQRLDFPLTREHFAAVRLNWKPKSENLRSIAQELNLGLESFVFIDDNPVECAEVQSNCPEVLTLLLPEDPAGIPRFLEHAWVFDHVKVTEEDRKRAESYRHNREREQLRSMSSGLADFIAGLGLKIDIQPLSESTVSRVAQLTQRTNQFNLTTRRRNESEILSLKEQVLTASVSDRFGDYGLVGVVIYKQKPEALDVDSFLLSCRVLGRGVEHALLAKLGEIARQRRLKYVDLHYIPTSKNRPALNFLESVAGSFRQQAPDGIVFRLPTGFAAEVTYNIQSSPPEPVTSPEPSARTQASRLETSSGLSTFAACRTVALKRNDIHLIHEQVEAGLSNDRSTSAGPAPETSMERTLCELWSKLLRRKDISVTDSFFDLGGHSLLAVRLFAEIERIAGRKYPLVTIFQAPTVRELARVLEGSTKRQEQGPHPLIVQIQPAGTLPALFLVHGAGGDVLWGYANLAAHLTSNRPVYGIKSRGQIGEEECKTIQEMASCYVDALRTVQPHGPYYLGGYCFGGNVAFEMARQLQAAGEKVDLVALLDSSPANTGYENVRWWSPVFGYRFLRNACYWLKDFSEMPLLEQKRFVLRKARVFSRKLKDTLFGRNAKDSFDLEQIIDLNHFPERELKLWQTHIQAMIDHVEQPYDGQVVLFRTRGQPILCSFEEDFCWGKLARKGVQVVLVPGSHENIFMEPNVKKLAEELGKHLPQAGEQANGSRHTEALAA